MSHLDLVIKNARVVRPNATDVAPMDIGIAGGRIVALAPAIAAEAAQTFDAAGLLAFPGAIDAHTHIGIYVHPHDDALTESAAAVSGGVTTLITYARTGSLYLNRGGSWREFYPELLRQSEGRYYTDYGYHMSPIEGRQIGEMEYMLCEGGAPNFGEVFMFYGLHGLHGRSDAQAQWLMLGPGDHYDLAHFDFICREAARLQRTYPELAPYIQVSFHCETPELLRAYEAVVQRDARAHHPSPQTPLQQYSAARPPHSEAIAISIVGALAHAAGLRQVNILHLTSREAMDAALRVRAGYPEVTFGLEATAGHLLFDDGAPCGVWGKVNPPLRSRDDVEYLWSHVLSGAIEWLVTDHANCPRAIKVDPSDPENIWKAKAGFGGTEYLLPAIFSEGTKRGLSPNRIAALLSWNPSRRFGLLRKGDIAEGFDADIALIDPNETWTICAADSLSAQGYTPFEGIRVRGRVKHTFVRGQRVFSEGRIVGPPMGRYVRRPM
ncbi:MAG: dihydropyrimidinase [Candidatus Roseilinea sp.]|nr:MAG: dihydropyrimidinase [Candidatus Roseilinea sp.]